MRADVQNPQRNVRLHDLEFFGVFVQKISVCQQEVWHVMPRPLKLPARAKAPRTNADASAGHPVSDADQEARSHLNCGSPARFVLRAPKPPSHRTSAFHARNSTN